MRNKWLWISLVMVAIVVFIAACGQSTTPPTEQAPAADQEETVMEEVEDEAEPAIDDVEALIIERCSKCHSADRVFQADYDEQGWSDEIDDMIRKGAEVTDEEKAIMIEWLISR
jgi:uncharacterized membrane protein